MEKLAYLIIQKSQLVKRDERFSNFPLIIISFVSPTMFQFLQGLLGYVPCYNCLSSYNLLSELS